MREIEDLVQATVTSIGTVAFVVSATPIAGYRTPAQAHTVGATFEYIAKAGNDWELGLGTLVDATHISRAPIRSSNGNALVNFTTAPTLYETVSGDYLRGTDAAALPVVTSAGTGDYLLLLRADGTVNRILASAVGGTGTGGGTPTASPTVTSVTVSPSAPSLAGGATQTFTASVVGTNSPAQTVTWSASAGTITSGGVFTAPASTASAQTITITARSTFDTAKTGTATVTVAATGTPAPTVSGVTVTPSTANVAGSATQQFTAAVAGTNSPSQGVSWSATVGTVNSAGLYTAPAATSLAQTATVTATSQQDGTKSGTATVTVAAAVAAPAYVVTLNAAASPGFPTTQSMGWTSGEAAVSAGVPLISMKTASNEVPDSATLKFVLGKSSSAPPMAYADGAPSTSSGNGNTSGHSNAVALVAKAGSWANVGDTNFGIFKPAGTFFAWGTPGTWYLWVLSSAGWSKVVSDSSGNPQPWVLS